MSHPNGLYTVSPFSPLCSGCLLSDAFLEHRDAELRCLTRISYAVYDQFLYTCSEFDARLDSLLHRQMLRTLVESVRQERDRFTQFLFDRGRLNAPQSQRAIAQRTATASERVTVNMPVFVDALESYRWQQRLQSHFACWNAALAELHAFFYPTRPLSKEALVRFKLWLDEQHAIARQSSDDHENENDGSISADDSIASTNMEADGVDSMEAQSATTNDSDYITRASSMDPSTLLSTFLDADASPADIGIPDSPPLPFASTAPAESTLEPSSAVVHLMDDVDTSRASMKGAKEPLSASLPVSSMTTAPHAYAHSLTSSLSTSPLPSPSISPSLRPAVPISRALTRSPLLSALGPLHHTPSPPPLNPPPSVGPESLFVALGSWPVSSVDFLRQTNSRKLPVLPWALPVAVHEDEPSSIVAYALASFEHLLSVARIQPSELSLLQQASVELQQREQPAFILPSQRISSKKHIGAQPLQVNTQLQSQASSSLVSLSDRTPNSANVPVNGHEKYVSRQTSSPAAHLPPHPSPSPSLQSLFAAGNGSSTPPHAQQSQQPLINPTQIEHFIDRPPARLTVAALYKVEESRDTPTVIESILCDSSDTQPLTITWHDSATPSPAATATFTSILSSIALSDRTSYSCTVYYPRHFHALRLFYSVGDYEIITSLCHSCKWAATGGKSGSTFIKTKDERFVLKFVRKPELLSFCEMASKYFDYLAKHAFHGLPSVLVPILGAYHFSAKKSRGNGSEIPSRYALLMPNLFASHKTSLHFDLKGSSTNRYIQLHNAVVTSTASPSTSQPPLADANGKADSLSQSATGEDLPAHSTPPPSRSRVLLDDNLMELTDNNGLPLTEESRAIVKMAIFNDSLFLASQECVDYSLLLGIDPANQFAVLGFIDYIRQYRSAERLETSIKSLTVAQPTVIPPKQYKQRFRTAMDKFFGLERYSSNPNASNDTSSVSSSESSSESLDDTASVDGSSDRYVNDRHEHSSNARTWDTGADTDGGDADGIELNDFSLITIDSQSNLHLLQLFESPSFTRRVDNPHNQ